MMRSQVLGRGDTEKGFAGMINREFDKVREIYTRVLNRTLNYRPVVLTLWIIVIMLIVPFYLFSQKELAPPEDQNFVFGIIQAAANSTIDQTKMFAKQVDDIYRSFPETKATFQIVFPTGGFGGGGAKPHHTPKRGPGAMPGGPHEGAPGIPGSRGPEPPPPSAPRGAGSPPRT